MEKISIIMPSFLGNYPGCATDRVTKLHRAVESVLNQTHTNWELIVIADGCAETIEEISKYADKRIKSFIIPKQNGFGIQRSTGVKMSTGNIICYLDSDDMFSPLHLEFIAENIVDYDWIWFNHYENRKDTAILKKVDINKPFNHGTCNIAHRNRVMWQSAKYGMDDFVFSNALKSDSKKYTFVGNGYYLVCHQSKITGNGFDS
jgi:glycosyltransferase involved in cell wall biosynthesis